MGLGPPVAGGGRGVPNAGLVFGEGDPARSTPRGGSWLRPRLDAAPQWGPHPLPSEGAFLFLPQVSHKGGHAHPRRGVPSRLSVPGAPQGDATPPAPPSPPTAVSRVAQGALAPGLRTHLASHREPLVPRSVDSVRPPLREIELWGEALGRGSNDRQPQAEAGRGGSRTRSGVGLQAPWVPRRPAVGRGSPAAGRAAAALVHICNPSLPGRAASESRELLLGQKVTVPFSPPSRIQLPTPASCGWRTWWNL